MAHVALDKRDIQTNIFLAQQKKYVVVPLRGASNEYPLISWRYKKNNQYIMIIKKSYLW